MHGGRSWGGGLLRRVELLSPSSREPSSRRVAAAVFLALLGCLDDRDGQLGGDDGPLAAAGTAEADVRRVIDGDTVELEDGTRVRILLVDAPEATRSQECFGAEATRFTRELLTGRHVRLTSDIVQLDRYGRALRHVAVAGRDVAEDLVRGGYACVLHIPPNGQGRVERLRRLEDVARLERRGLWSCRAVPCGT